MNCLLKNEVSRCRPYLGTYVVVRVQASCNDTAINAINAAFGEIERIHRCMSFHDVTSEVSLLNQQACTASQKISDDMWHVLKAAETLYDLSEGIFDITIVPKLVETGALPRHDFWTLEHDWIGRGCDIDLSKRGWVRFRKPLCIDLGGIAKGYAVDQAIAILQSFNIEGAIINAGGDMRCFGDNRQEVFVRHPKKENRVLAMPDLYNEAIATSAIDERSVHVHGRLREAMLKPYSVSVVAQRCMEADALTKVVMALGMQSENILEKYQAKAYLVYPDDNVVFIESRHC